jgi:thiopurine S-methyltransferase
MEPEFWQRTWQEESTRTSFHRPDIHPHVQQYATPQMLENKRVLIPLCGKTKDMLWFQRFASQVIGVELVEKPIMQFFSENNLDYQKIDPSRYEAERITLLHKNIFDTQLDDVGTIDLVYDRAALVALPIPMRLEYVRKIDSLLPVKATILLNIIEYQPELPVPPFSITPEEIRQYYGTGYTIEHLEQPEMPRHGMIRKFGLAYLKEHFFRLTKYQHLTATELNHASKNYQLS